MTRKAWLTWLAAAAALGVVGIVLLANGKMGSGALVLAVALTGAVYHLLRAWLL